MLKTQSLKLFLFSGPLARRRHEGLSDDFLPTKDLLRWPLPHGDLIFDMDRMHRPHTILGGPDWTGFTSQPGHVRSHAFHNTPIIVLRRIKDFFRHGFPQDGKNWHPIYNSDSRDFCSATRRLQKCTGTQGGGRGLREGRGQLLMLRTALIW